MAHLMRRGAQCVLDESLLRAIVGDSWGPAMLDTIFLTGTVALFVLAVSYVCGCDTL
jgi:hypothetical protein